MPGLGQNGTVFADVDALGILCGAGNFVLGIFDFMESEANGMTSLKMNFSLVLAAVTCPTWLKFLSETSPALAFVLQTLGIGLAILQIVRLLKDWRTPRS